LTFLSQSLEELLLKHECVVVPGLGGFLMRSYSSSANPFSKELKSSGTSLFFNAALNSDDGLLAKLWSDSKGLTYAQSLAEIRSLAVEIQREAESKKPVPFGKLGHFFLNPHGQLFFIPAQSLNLSLEHFGLPIFKWNSQDKPANSPVLPKQESVQVTSVEADIEDAEVAAVADEWTDTLERKLDKNPLWKVAANIALVMVVAALLVLNVRTFKKAYDNRVDQQASMQLPAEIRSQVPENAAASEETNQQTSTLKYALGEAGIESLRLAMYHQEGDVFICGGSYITPKMAETECLLWQKLGYDATYIELENSSLVRVVLARFLSDVEASNIAKDIKQLAAGRLSVEYLTPAPVL